MCRSYIFPRCQEDLDCRRCGEIGKGVSDCSSPVHSKSVHETCMHSKNLVFNNIYYNNFFFLQDIFCTHSNIDNFRQEISKHSFSFFSYKFTVKHRVKTSHKIIIMMHYHYNIMIVRTKQNDNFSLLISALQTYDQKYYENLTSYKTASIKFLWVVHVLQQNKTPKNLLVFEKAYIHHH